MKLKLFTALLIQFGDDPVLYERMREAAKERIEFEMRSKYPQLAQECLDTMKKLSRRRKN